MTAHARCRPEPGRDRDHPAGRGVALGIGPGVGDGQRRAGDDGDGDAGPRTSPAAPPVVPEPAEDRQQRDPDGERQPRPGGALEDQVVAVADREDDDREQPTVAAPDGIEQTQAQPRRDRPRRPGRAGRHEPGRDRLGRLEAAVARCVHDVVERPDRRLEGRHRDPETQRGHGIRAGDDGDRPHDEPVEQATGTGGSSRISPPTRRPRAPPREPAPVRRRRSRRSSRPGTRSAGRARRGPGRGSRARARRA